MGEESTTKLFFKPYLKCGKKLFETKLFTVIPSQGNTLTGVYFCDDGTIYTKHFYVILQVTIKKALKTKIHVEFHNSVTKKAEKV